MRDISIQADLSLLCTNKSIPTFHKILVTATIRERIVSRLYERNKKKKETFGFI